MTYQPPFNGKRVNIKADSNSVIDNGTVTLASGSNVNLSQVGSTITVASTVTAQGGDVLSVGTIQMYAGSSAPSGWALCNGAALNRTTYADLFAAISTTYGVGDGSSTFNIPDLRARVPVGAGTGTLVMTFSSRSTNTITVTGVSNTADNEIQTGVAVTYATTGTDITGLSAANNPYYLIRQSNTSFQLATSLANAVIGTSAAVALSGDGTGTRTFTITIGTKTAGNSGGEETHALLSAELPSHTHAVGTLAAANESAHTHGGTGLTTSDPGNHTHAQGVDNDGQPYSSGARQWHDHSTGISGSVSTIATGGAGAHTHTIGGSTAAGSAHTHTLSGSTDTAGSSGTHNNLQPYVAVNYIIKTVSTVTGNGNISAEYLRAQELTDQTTDVSANDHIKFDTNQSSSGGSISLDTATTYTTTAAVASIGRFTLISGKTYLLRGALQSVDFSTSAGTLTYQWYDATNSSTLGSSAVISSHEITGSGTGGYAEAVVAPVSNILVELRIISATAVSRIGVNSTSEGQASALVQLLIGTSTSGGTATAATFNIATKTADYTLTSSDTMLLVNAGSGNVIITLPSANSFSGYRYYIKRIDSSGNTLTIARTGGNTIDGATSASIVNQYTVTGFVSDGNNWYVL